MSNYKTVLNAGDVRVRVCSGCRIACYEIINGSKRLQTDGKRMTNIIAKLDGDLQDETAETITIGDNIVVDQGEAQAILEVLKQDWRA